MHTTADPGTARSSSVESVMHALMSIGRLIRQRSQGETLDTGTFYMLKTIHAHGSMRVTELAALANLDTSTVSRHVAHLHRVGLIERTPDPDDRRAQRVRLSDEGAAQLATAFNGRRALLERSLDGWTPEDLEQLDRLLTRFVGDVDTLTEDLEKA
jgi:DNA-binding MarR family transcriptional regulator